jgi:hypothetical protein
MELLLSRPDDSQRDSLDTEALRDGPSLAVWTTFQTGQSAFRALVESALDHSRKDSLMKKIVLLVVAVAAALLATRKAKAGQREQALWAEATDDVTRS